MSFDYGKFFTGVESKECDAEVRGMIKMHLDYVGYNIADFQVADLIAKISAGKAVTDKALRTFAAALIKYGYTALRQRTLEDSEDE